MDRPAARIAAGVGRIVDLSVGNRDDAGQALARHLSQRALERPEQQGAVVPAVEPDPNGPDLQIVQSAQFFPDRRQGLRIQPAARFEALAGRFVHDDHRDVRQGFPHFIDQRRIRQNRPDQGRRQGPVQNAPRSPVEPEQKQGGGDAGQRRQQPPGHKRRKGDAGSRSDHLCAQIIGRAGEGSSGCAPGPTCSCRSGRASRC